MYVCMYVCIRRNNEKSHDAFLSETRLWGSYDLWSHGRLGELVRDS